MTLRISILLLILVQISATAFAQKITPANAHRYYSIDELPVQWLDKPHILRTIDDLLPLAVKELRNSRPCQNCNAKYTITYKVDTIYIINSDLLVYDRDNNSLYKALHTVRFRFRSYLSVSIGHRNEIARVILTDPNEPKIFVINTRPYHQKRLTTAPIVYWGSMHAHVIGSEGPIYLGSIVPTDEELAREAGRHFRTIHRMMKKW